jgi:hypothetical protein
MKRILALIAVLWIFCGCATLDRQSDIYATKAELIEAEARGATDEEIAVIEARLEELEGEAAGKPIIDTGNPAANSGIEAALTLLLGFLGIRWWRGTPDKRKGTLPA